MTVKNGRAWCSVELPRKKADKLQEYLYKQGVLFEPSECYKLVHFECFMNDEELEAANKWIKDNLN